MLALNRMASGLARGMAVIGAMAVLVMMLHICLDVLLRNVFRIALLSTSELVARYYMVAVAFLPLGWIELRRDMVSVELVDAALSPLMKWLSDLSVLLAGAAIYGTVAWTNWVAAFENYRRGTFVEFNETHLAVWHSYFLPPLGFTLATLACLVLALNRLLDQQEKLA
ncbi:MAG: TRAP transporter small permease [bacterium]